MIKKIVFSITLLALLISCKVGPDYQAPKSSLPTSWKDYENKNNPTAENSVKSWWQIFNDETLEMLISEASQQNLNLKTATAKIAEARANNGLAQSALLPELTANASGSRNKQFFAPMGKSLLYNIFSGDFNVSWEIDLFGGTKRKLEASIASLAAIEADKNALIISISAEVARNYIDFRNFQNQLLIAENSLAADQKITDLMEKQLKFGKISKLEFFASKSQLELSKANMRIIENQLKATQYNIEALIGKHPGDLESTLSEIKPVPVANQDLILKTPTEIIETRPDIKAAERRLASATAMQGVAASYQYPKINLSGLIGVQSDTLHDLFFSPGKSWSFGGGITAPLFNYGKIKSNMQIADALHDEALLGYEQIVIDALKDTQISLVSYLKADERRKNFQEAKNDNKAIMEIMEKRYNVGSNSLIDLLNSQKNFYNSQLTSTNATADAAIKLITLYKEMGGFMGDSNK